MMKAILRKVSQVVSRFRKGEGEYPHFFWHSEMDDRGGCEKCPIWSGRAHLYLTDRKVWDWEWHWFTLRNRTLGTSLTLFDDDGEDGTTFSFKIPWLCNLYVSTEGYLKPRTDIQGGVKFGAEYHFDHSQLGILSLSWNHAESWGDRVQGWSKWLDMADVVFGRDVVAKEIVRQEPGKFWMKWQGEREEYEVNLKIERMKWTRPRDWFGLLNRDRLIIDFDIPAGIPEPGKGENSWDCEDDAVFGVSRSVNDASDAEIDRAWHEVVQQINKTRESRGGASWRPKKSEATA